jgi:hypothetical protein
MSVFCVAIYDLSQSPYLCGLVMYARFVALCRLRMETL